MTGYCSIFTQFSYNFQYYSYWLDTFLYSHILNENFTISVHIERWLFSIFNIFTGNILVSTGIDWKPFNMQTYWLHSFSISSHTDWTFYIHSYWQKAFQYPHVLTGYFSIFSHIDWKPFIIQFYGLESIQYPLIFSGNIPVSTNIDWKPSKINIYCLETFQICVVLVMRWLCLNVNCI